MTWRHVALYFVVLLLVVLMLFTLSLSMPNDGSPFAWNHNQVIA